MEAAKVAPPTAVTGLSFGGLELNQWILWGTLIYTVLLILHKLFQIYKDVHRFRKGAPDTEMGDPK